MMLPLFFWCWRKRRRTSNGLPRVSEKDDNMPCPSSLCTGERERDAHPRDTFVFLEEKTFSDVLVSSSDAEERAQTPLGKTATILVMRMGELWMKKDGEKVQKGVYIHFPPQLLWCWRRREKLANIECLGKKKTCLRSHEIFKRRRRT
jgi:hypothetical protein